MLRLGIGVAAVFVALAGVSSSWSPLARRPLLDGLGPLLPYRWVAPPPQVKDNQTPAVGRFDIPVREGRSSFQTLFTADKQVTVIFDRGAVSGASADGVRVLITPLDPSTLGPLPSGLAAFGNAVRLDAGSAARFSSPVAAILLYPETTTLHALSHELLWSADGTAWRPLKTNESLAQQQVQGAVPGPGYLVVAGVPKEVAVATGTTQRGAPIVTVLWVVIVVCVLGLLATVIRAWQLRD
ncbi:MAG: hypothetical protein ACXVQJ_09500 [Actinomycetota bacterium]